MDPKEQKEPKRIAGKKVVDWNPQGILQYRVRVPRFSFPTYRIKDYPRGRNERKIVDRCLYAFERPFKTPLRPFRDPRDHGVCYSPWKVLREGVRSITQRDTFLKLRGRYGRQFLLDEAREGIDACQTPWNMGRARRKLRYTWTNA